MWLQVAEHFTASALALVQQADRLAHSFPAELNTMRFVPRRFSDFSDFLDFSDIFSDFFHNSQFGNI